MGLAHSPRIITNNLVFCIDVGNTKSYSGSGNTWIDISRNGNVGTLTNGPSFNSSNGSGILFDGTDDYVSFSSSANVKTILAFVRPSIVSGDYVVYGLDANGSDNWFGINTNKLYAFATQSQDLNNFSVSGNTTLSANTWYQIGCTISDNTLKVYLNGKEDGTTTQVFTIGLWNTAPTMGRRGSINQRYYNGLISNVTAYDRVLSESEIMQNFNALRGRFGI